MQLIRCFIAIPIAPGIQKSAARLVGRLSGEGDGIKWVPTDNLHLTLKFLGDVDNREVPQVCGVIRRCCQHVEPFTAHFRGVGGFPSPSRARVVYAGVDEGGDSLSRLVQGLEVQLAEMGFKPEPRDYVPHLTIGRTRGGSRRGSPEVAERIAQNAACDLGSMEIDRVLLMASFLDKAGPTYQVMDTVRL